MLTLVVESEEMFDHNKQEFVTSPRVVLHLEHSLASLSKWESIYLKPFLQHGDNKTQAEVLGYFNAMITDVDAPPGIIHRLSQAQYDEINEYIGSVSSATTFVDTPENRARARGEVITSELIYYWMYSYGVPHENENIHLNRLFSLLRIYTIKNSKEKKMPSHEAAEWRRQLNEQRRAAMNSSG